MIWLSSSFNGPGVMETPTASLEMLSASQVLGGQLRVFHLADHGQQQVPGREGDTLMTLDSSDLVVLMGNFVIRSISP